MDLFSLYNFKAKIFKRHENESDTDYGKRYLESIGLDESYLESKDVFCNSRVDKLSQLDVLRSNIRRDNKNNGFVEIVDNTIYHIDKLNITESDSFYVEQVSDDEYSFNLMFCDGFMTLSEAMQKALGKGRG